MGRFLDIAPHLLHGGKSVQTPPPAHEGWWAACAEAELVHNACHRGAQADSTTGGPTSWRQSTPAQFGRRIRVPHQFWG